MEIAGADGDAWLPPTTIRNSTSYTLLPRTRRCFMASFPTWSR